MVDDESLGELAGKHVSGADGEDIGRIVDVYESSEGGGTFATVNTGRYGSGASFFPLEAAELLDDEVVVPYSQSFVEDAPSVGTDDHLSADEERRLLEYYSQAGGVIVSATTADSDALGVQGQGRGPTTTGAELHIVVGGSVAGWADIDGGGRGQGGGPISTYHIGGGVSGANVDGGGSGKGGGPTSI